DRVDLGIAWIAVLRHPLLHTTAACVVTSKCHDVRASVFLEQSTDLGSPHLHIVNRVGYETFPIIGDTEPLCGIAPGFRRNLHQPDCLGRRPVALIKGALGAHNRIDHAFIDWGSDRSIRRHPNLGKGMLFGWQTSCECGLADGQHRLRVMVARSELAKPMKRCNIAACFSKIADERQRKIELTYCIKNVSSMQQIALSSVHRLWWCRAHRNLTQTKPGP